VGNAKNAKDAKKGNTAEHSDMRLDLAKAALSPKVRALGPENSGQFGVSHDPGLRVLGSFFHPAFWGYEVARYS
jgi:hypothetical protein